MNRTLLSSLLALGLLGVLGARAEAQTLVFDNMTGATNTFSGTVPHAMGGMAFSLGNVGSGPVTISGLDFSFVASAAATYTNVVADVSFFSTASNLTTGTTPAFTGLLATRRITLGAVSPTGATIYTYQNSAAPGTSPAVTFNTPFAFSGGTNLGVQMLFLGDTGGGLAYTDNLAFTIRTGSAPAVGTMTAGTAGTNGYYRNASQATPTSSQTSLLASDFRSLTGSTTNQGLPMRLYTNAAPVPEPASMAALGFGALALLRRRRKAV